MGYVSDLFCESTIGRPILAGAVIGGCLSLPKGVPGMIGGAIGGALLFAVIWGICHFFLKSYGGKLQTFPLKQDTSSIEDNHPGQNLHRLTIEQAKQNLYKVVSEMSQSLFSYIYLFAFDREDRLVWGNVIIPDDTLNKL